MSVYDINQPWTYDDNWHIFPQTTLSDLDLNDCNDTIDGLCRYTETVEECADICGNDPQHMCTGGYFIKTPGNYNNICVPLRDYSEQQTIPFYRLRHKNFYPQLRELDSTFFLQKSFPWPPDMANGLFYQDQMYIKNVNTGLFLGSHSDGTITEQVVLSNTEKVLTQFVPSQLARENVSNNVMIKNGASIAINIPNTSLILRKSATGNDIQWLMRAAVINDPNNTFTIHSSDPTHKMMYYGQQFYFKYFEQLVEYDEESGLLRVINSNYDDAIRDGKNILFEFIPQVTGYYCDGSECKEVSLSETTNHRMKARFEGHMVSRSSSCWSMCEKKSNTPLIVGIILVIIIIISMFIVF